MRTERRQSERALVCAAQKGDKEALQMLLGSNWAWIKGLVYSILRDADDIDDVLQDICVRVISKIDSLRQPERFRPWLAVLARRQALRYRQRKAQRLRHLNEGLADLKCNEKNAELFEIIEQKEQYRRVLNAIGSLPEKYRQVFVLEHINDLTYRQISEILDIPVSTVQIRLVRARQMLYKQLTGKEKNRVREK